MRHKGNGPSGGRRGRQPGWQVFFRSGLSGASKPEAGTDSFGRSLVPVCQNENAPSSSGTGSVDGGRGQFMAATEPKRTRHELVPGTLQLFPDGGVS